MSHFTMQLLKQIEAVSGVARALFLQNNQRFDGQQQVINLLGKEDGMTQGNLAELLDIRPSSLAELIKKLEKAGAVTRVEDENDKRIKRVYLTEEGRKRVIQTSDVREDLSAQFFAGLTEEEQQQFSRYLDKIVDGWPEDFDNYQTRTNDPMERLAEFQQLRQTMMGVDWQALSRQDQHRVHRDFKRQLRQAGMDNRMWKRQFEQIMREQRGMHRGGFNDRPFERPCPPKQEHNSESDWTDF